MLKVRGLLSTPCFDFTVHFILDECLVFRYRPVRPFPNSYAHPLPRFIYSSETGEISAQFAGASSKAWRSKTYLLTSIPKRRPGPRNIIDFLHQVSSLPSRFSLGMWHPQARPAWPDEVFNGDINLTEDFRERQERGS